MFEQQTNEQLKRIADALELIAMNKAKNESKITRTVDRAETIAETLAQSMIGKLLERGIKI